MVAQKQVFWTIPLFSKEWAQNQDFSNELSSNPFEVRFGNQISTWALFLRPNVSIHGLKHSICNYIVLRDSTSTQFQGRFQIGIQSSGSCQNSSSREIQPRLKSLLKPVFQQTFGKVENSSLASDVPGAALITQIISHEILFNPERELVVDGKLTITCKV